MGEERTEERTINIPYSILPAKESEYILSAGVLQDSTSSRFAKGELNYGITRCYFRRRIGVFILYCNRRLYPIY